MTSSPKSPEWQPGSELTTSGEARRLRILMVSARFAPFVGGTEIHTGRVSEELTRRGHAVTVLTTDAAGSLPKEEMVGDVHVIRVPAYPRRTDLYVAPALSKAIRAGSWDLVHIQGYHTAVAPLALAAAQKAGLPTVVTFHSGGHSSRLRNLIRPIQVRLLWRFLMKADRLFGVSEFEANLFAERLRTHRSRIKVIPNGVSQNEPWEEKPEPATAASADETSSVGVQTILSVGRLVRYKGHHRVIQALPHLLELRPATRLLILGDGPYKKDLQRLAKRLGVENSVDFDYVPSSEPERLRQILRDASLAVLLSDYESHGMAAHEALTVGLPLVVMDSSALGELVTSGLAQAAPPQATHQEVAEIVARSLDRPRDRGHLETPPTHTWASIADRLETQYLQVMARRCGQVEGPRSGADGSP